MIRLVRTILGLIALCAASGAPARAEEQVDLLLVLASDVSRSVDTRKFELQRQGYAAALSNAPRHPALRLTVNAHASTLGRDHDFPDFVCATADAHGIPRESITVEIVEHAPPWDSYGFATALERLRLAGMRVALDDVGLGQSNFKMLLDASPEFLKLDRYFVDGCANDPKRRAVISSIEELARRFGARVIAEGVENEEDLMAVRTIGVSLVQGFLFSKPLSALELTVH